MPLPGGIEGASGRVGVHVTEQQADPQADNMSYSHAVVPLLTTRFLFCGRGVRGQWGVGVSGAGRGCREIRGIGAGRGCRGVKGIGVAGV